MRAAASPFAFAAYPLLTYDGPAHTRSRTISSHARTGNVLLDGTSNAKLGDFGLAKELTSGAQRAASPAPHAHGPAPPAHAHVAVAAPTSCCRRPRAHSPASVLADTHVGTPYFMSPEMVNGSAYGEKSDIWVSSGASCVDVVEN